MNSSDVPEGKFEVHAHLLPGIDDGCANLEESLACARMMVEAGYRRCFCTPHVWPNLPQNTAGNIGRCVRELQSQLDGANIPLRLFPGGEINLREDLPLSLRLEDIITYNLGGQYVLVDMWAERFPEFFVPTIKWLQKLSLEVILAHPERMRAVQDDPDSGARLADLGLILQGNLQCLTDAPDALTRLTVEKFLLEDRYFLLASDLHNPRTLPLRLKGLQVARQIVGQEKLDELTARNPRALLVAR